MKTTNKVRQWSRVAVLGTIALVLALLLLVVSGGVPLRGSGAAGVPPAPAAPQPYAAPAQSRTITYQYDGAGRLTMANYGGDGLLVYSYDQAGNLVRITDHVAIYLPLVTR